MHVARTTVKTGRPTARSPLLDHQDPRRREVRLFSNLHGKVCDTYRNTYMRPREVEKTIQFTPPTHGNARQLFLFCLILVSNVPLPRKSREAEPFHDDKGNASACCAHKKTENTFRHRTTRLLWERNNSSLSIYTPVSPYFPSSCSPSNSHGSIMAPKFSRRVLLQISPPFSSPTPSPSSDTPTHRTTHCTMIKCIICSGYETFSMSRKEVPPFPPPSPPPLISTGFHSFRCLYTMP